MAPRPVSSSRPVQKRYHRRVVVSRRLMVVGCAPARRCQSMNWSSLRPDNEEIECPLRSSQR
jgi:hypothetical protein